MAEPRRGLPQLLRQDADFADDRHEVGVAGPSRHEVHVEVIHDARSGRAAEVDADVDALRLIRLRQRALGVLREAHHLDQLFVASSAARLATCRLGTTIRWPLL